MGIDNFYDDHHKASHNKIIEGREYISYTEFKRLLKMCLTEQLQIYRSYKRIYKYWMYSTFFGLGYILVDIIRYVY